MKVEHFSKPLCSASSAACLGVLCVKGFLPLSAPRVRRGREELPAQFVDLYRPNPLAMVFTMVSFGIIVLQCPNVGPTQASRNFQIDIEHLQKCSRRIVVGIERTE